MYNWVKSKITSKGHQNITVNTWISFSGGINPTCQLYIAFMLHLIVLIILTYNLQTSSSLSIQHKFDDASEVRQAFQRICRLPWGQYINTSNPHLRDLILSNGISIRRKQQTASHFQTSPNLNKIFSKKLKVFVTISWNEIDHQNFPL